MILEVASIDSTTMENTDQKFFRCFANNHIRMQNN